MSPRQRALVFLFLAIAVTQLFLGAIIAHAKPEVYRPYVVREAQFRFGVPAPAPVIAGQIQQESAWNPAAISPVGAQGLMQFMPQTSNWSAVAAGFNTVEPFSAAWSIRAGVWYDRWLWDRITQYWTECDRWQFALSAYNGGLGWVYKRQKLSSDPRSFSTTSVINPGIHPANQKENAEYAVRIMRRHQPAFRSWGRSVCLN